MFRIKNKVFSGSSMNIAGRNIYIDEEIVHVAEESRLEIYVLEGASVNKISSDESLIIKGNIEGPVTATSVNCDNVTGNIVAKTVNCDKVVGDIHASGNVNCDKVSGSVIANKVNRG